MQNEIRCRFSQKHDIEANWIKAGNAENPFIPWEAELIIYDPDENYNYTRFKIGDGVTNVNDLPFSTQQADWNQNDKNAADYVKNRTHYYEELPINREDVILDKAYAFEEVIVEESGTGEFKYPLVKDWSEIITAGSKLIVTIWGDTYEAIFADSRYSVELPGLAADAGYDDPWNYPTMYFEEDGITLYFGYNAGGGFMDIGPLTISTNKEAVVHQLDEKFIPDTIARINELPNTGTNTAVTGEGASAFGIESIARGDATHAEGYQSLAGSYSFKFNLDHEYTEADYDKTDGTGWYYLTDVTGLNDLFPSVINENVQLDECCTFEKIITKEEYNASETINLIFTCETCGKTYEISWARCDEDGISSEEISHVKIEINGRSITEWYLLDAEGSIYDWLAVDIYTANELSKPYEDIEYTLVLKNNYDFWGNLLAVNEENKAIQVSNYKIPVVGTGTEVKDTSYFIIPTHPELGTEFVIGAGAHAEGYQTVAFALGAHAEGYASIASGKYSHAEGRETKAGYAAHAEGRETLAKGENSHAEGVWTKALGGYSHAEGFESVSSGSKSHAEGIETESAGVGSHAEGTNTLSSGNSSHAEGQDTIASGVKSHAEGSASIASGANSHAEGSTTIASGTSSHAEGQSTKAIGESSHAEGGFSEARGKRSHAEGSTIAGSEFQHTEGKYNIIDENNEYAHIVGNGSGSSASQRSNAHTLDWNGNAWYAGGVTVGANKEKLATEAYCGYSRDIWFIPYGAQESCLFRFDTTAKTLTVRAIRILSPKLIDITTETVLSLEGISNNPNFLIFDHEATSNEYLKIVKRDALKNLTTKYSVILTFNLSALTNPNNVSYKGPYSVNGVIYNKSYNDNAINNLISQGSAASAIADEDGNNIIETYATKAELTELEDRLKEYIDNQILAAITSALNTEV